MSSSRTAWGLFALVVLTLLLAFTLRIYRLPDQSLWYDEALSVHYAIQPLSGTLAGVSGSDHPPLHSLLLHFWMTIAGQSELAVRYLSVWWGVLGVALLYRLGKQFFDKPTALMATVLLTVSPFHVWYSQEARMYSLALALSLGVVLTLHALVAYRKASPWPWLGYTLMGVLALYAHFYTSFILLFANVAFAGWWLLRVTHEGWQMTRGLLIRWAAAQAAILLLFLPWGHFVAEQYATNATYWHGALGLGQIIRDTALAFAAGDRVRTPLAQVAALALAATALLGLQAAARSGSDSANRGISRGERALWLLLWLAVPVTTLFAISHNRPKFAPRYLLPALPAMFLLAAVGSACLASWVWKRRSFPGQRVWRWLATAGLLLAGTLVIGASIVSLQRQYSDRTLARPDFRAVSHYVDQHAEIGDVVVLVGGHSYPAFAYYSEGNLAVHPMPPDLLPSTRDPLDYRAVAQLAEIAAGRERLWLVLWQDRLADPTGVVLNHLLHTCPRLDVDKKFHGLALLLFSVADCDLTKRAGPSYPLRAEFGGQMRLLGYDLAPAAAMPGTILHLTLYWEAMCEVAANYTTFVQLLGPDGHIYAQHDRLTGDDAYPTSHWQPGAVIFNPHALTVSPGTPPGTYRLIAGLYVADRNLPRLPVTYPPGTIDDAVVLGEIKVEN
jgi:mannosyltransferase